MRSGGNDFKYFQLTELVNFVQFKTYAYVLSGGLGFPPLATSLPMCARVRVFSVVIVEKSAALMHVLSTYVL